MGKLNRRRIGLSNYARDDSTFRNEQIRIQRLEEREKQKTDPNFIRSTNALAIAQGMHNDLKDCYSLMLEKMYARADELKLLILQDLGLDEDVSKPLTFAEMKAVFDYYSNFGLKKLKNSVTVENINEYGLKVYTPYAKMFAELIDLRAEFLIFAPDDRINLSAPYKKVKDPEMKSILAKRMRKLGIFAKYENISKYKELYELACEKECETSKDSIQGEESETNQL